MVSGVGREVEKGGSDMAMFVLVQSDGQERVTEALLGVGGH
jgi:hypothetical protein